MSQTGTEELVKPSAYQLFCMYYLGLTPEYRAKFYNVNSVARHFGVTPKEVENWLFDYHIQPSVFPRIDYNLAEAHGKAQELGMFYSTDEAKGFAKKTFKEVISALDNYSEKAWFEDVDYDDLWGDFK